MCKKGGKAMKKLKLWISLICLGMGVLSSPAHDFTATVDGQKIYFNIISKTRHTAEVTYRGSIADKHMSDVQGVLEIPAKVKHDKVVYQITRIGSKAFSGATELMGIVLPSTVKEIGDFAFEGCTSLEKVLFPGGDVKLGQGTFFKCTVLKNLSFGSDWHTLNLAPYRWSDSLRTITVPAKVEKIMNLKSVASLREVEVDANNARFSSYKGILYDKNGTTLYGVPRAYEGALKVKEGTTVVTNGAMIDCPGITLLDLPASLRTISFRETSRMSGLQEIVLRSTEPLTTAYAGGQGCFLWQVANPSVVIQVPKEAKKEYVKQLVDIPGEYTESAQSGSIPYRVESVSLPQRKQIHGLKNFDDYD